MNLESINQGLNAYLQSLTPYQKYAWIAVILGFFLVIFALILW